MSNVQDASVTGASSRTPQRILLVDDDELELELMADRLKSLGFETHTVSDGSAALELLKTQSFPVVITDWQMPRMDGIRLTENLRNQGDSDTYIIMLTVLDDHSSHERGYFAGVDDYLSKRAPDAKIVAGIRAGFRAVEMRQALHAVRQQQGAGLVSDVASGVLADRMRAELKRAARYGRNLSILAMELQSQSGEPVAADTMAQAVSVVSDSIRIDIDFATRYRGHDGKQRIAVVLPETNGVAAAGVGVRLSATLAARLLTPLESFMARVGCASFTPEQETGSSQPISTNIEALLREAEAGARIAPTTVPTQRRTEVL
ncbi:diguanylate cyclase response regulator [Steroidobacter agaridevorans]|uniref:Diguanylate cyclase response regulator n=1 Tax=Steroidobacter agaridevorans TaxID=2695856 RepID=A0A829YKB6_9GAMM|nr:response regulator [Steroidobacter agaridevorans]GFE83797.1 diguanylate cyclase response regulator [Steroidobacter agaridevorans]